MRLFLLLSLTALISSSCIQEVVCKRGNGETVTEERDASDFDAISLEMAADVYFTQDEEYSVEVVADENLLDIIQTKVTNGKLKIRLDRASCIRGKSTVEIYVTGPDLVDIDLSGSGKVVIEDALETRNLTTLISGSGEINIDELYGEEINATITGSGTIHLQSPETIDYADYQITGSGNIEAEDLSVDVCDVKISGSGSVYTDVVEELNVRISGSGSVYYTGKPSIDFNATGSGKIHDRN